MIAAAVLHDVVEDAGIAIEEIETRFGKRVRELVEYDTSAWLEYKTLTEILFGKGE